MLFHNCQLVISYEVDSNAVMNGLKYCKNAH